jgi:hypothetical protein
MKLFKPASSLHGLDPRDGSAMIGHNNNFACCDATQDRTCAAA